jgi:hypothetical protein
MTPDERKMLSDLADKVAQTPPPPEGSRSGRVHSYAYREPPGCAICNDPDGADPEPCHPAGTAADSRAPAKNFGFERIWFFSGSIRIGWPHRATPNIRGKAAAIQRLRLLLRSSNTLRIRPRVRAAVRPASFGEPPRPLRVWPPGLWRLRASALCFRIRAMAWVGSEVA